MAARGTIAKTNVENKIRETFGTDFIAIQDKKLYVWADDGGQRVQIALTLTCPKEGLEVEAPATNFIEDTSTIDFTPEEERTIEELFRKLNL